MAEAAPERDPRQEEHGKTDEEETEDEEVKMNCAGGLRGYEDSDWDSDDEENEEEDKDDEK